MAFLRASPTDDIAAAVQEMEAQSKRAMMWFLVVAAIVAVIWFSGSRK